MMIPARKASPDSDVVVSSEDERPWPSSMAFGKFPMKESGMPGLPGGIWSNQKRGSFKMTGSAAREARLNVVNPAHAAALRPVNTPSPPVSEGANTLPFAIPLQPTPKSGRSLSHSQGQREPPQRPNSQSGTAGRGSAQLLGQLTEEVDTESDSETGSRLNHTISHPPIGSLARPATLQTTYEHYGNGLTAEELSPTALPRVQRGQTFESAFANFSIDHPPRRQWQSHLGWDDVPNVNESRRHSLADLPTRRGSVAGGESSRLSRVFTSESIDDEPIEYQGFAIDREADPSNDRQVSRAQETAGGNHIPPMYRVPIVQLNQQERSELEARREQQPAMMQQQWLPGGAGRAPRKQLYIVSFKCSRVDVFYLLDNTGLRVREGDMVIVEADRGQDLGTVQHANVEPNTAKILKKKYSEEQYKWLMMYSRNKDGYNPNAQVHGENGTTSGQLLQDAPLTMQGTIPRDNFNNLKPKAIKRLASDHEIKMLAEKEGNEAKAKRTCQQKVAYLRLQMEILDAEWQWDFQKLIFYYYADHYINFKDLITELYRIYKTRIWLSAINPASFSQHAMGQPPSGIGPGAVSPHDPYAQNSTYTMAYGEDRDPYGAQMPYRIPYDTYTPNYPAIPGVANSFAPGGMYPSGNNFMYYGQVANEHSAVITPTQANVDEITPTPGQYPSASRPGMMANRGSFYDRMPNTDRHFVPGERAFMAPQSQHVSSFAHSETAFHRLDAPDRRFDRGSHQGLQDFTSPLMHQAVSHTSWNAMSGVSSQGSGPTRPGAFPNPIGTARPTSQGQEFRMGNAEWKPPRPRGFGTVDTAPNVGRIDSTGEFHGRTNVQQSDDAAASRASNLNRYFANLPSPDDMHADDMSRER